MDTPPNSTGSDDRASSLESDVGEPRKAAGSFLGNVLALSGGTAVAQIVVLLAVPVVSRLFGPDVFGVAAVCGSIIVLVSACGCFQYQLAVLLPKRDEDASQLLGLCLIATVIVVAALAVVLALAGHVILPLLKVQAVLAYAWVIPVGVLVTCLAMPLTYWYNRQKQFKRLALAKVLGAIAGTVAVLAVGFAGGQTERELILARIVGMFVILAVLFVAWCRYDAGFVLRNCTARGMWHQARRYKKFPLVTSWQTILGIGTLQAPTFLLAGFFGPAVAGLYALGRKILSLPSLFISQAIGQVLFQRTAEAKAADKSLARLAEEACKSLILVGLLPLAIVAVTGPDLFGVVFGQPWILAGLYARILSPLVFVTFVFFPMAHLFFVLERQGADLASRIVTVFVTLGALAYGGLVLKDIVWTLVIYMVVTSLGRLWRLSYLLRAVSARRSSLLVLLALAAAFAAPVAIGYGVCRWLWNLPLWLCFLTLVPCSVPYSVFAYRHDRHVRMAVLRISGKLRRSVRRS